MSITIFEEVTTESVLLGLEADGLKYAGLVVDMEVKEQRKYVKESAALIAGLLKKLDRSRIDKSKDFKHQVETEAASIKARLEAANLPFSMLIDAYANDRKLILAKQKAAEEFKALRDEVEAGHEMGLLMNAEHIRQKLAAEAQAKADQARYRADLIKQATIDADKRIEEADKRREEAQADRLEQLKKSLLDKVAAESLAEYNRIEAADSAKWEKTQAVKAEKQRQVEEKKAAATAKALREADTEHRRQVNCAAKEDFIRAGLSDENAQTAVKALASNMIRCSSINY